jgi:hypothetical protein
MRESSRRQLLLPVLFFGRRDMEAEKFQITTPTFHSRKILSDAESVSSP